MRVRQLPCCGEQRVTNRRVKDAILRDRHILSDALEVQLPNRKFGVDFFFRNKRCADVASDMSYVFSSQESECNAYCSIYCVSTSSKEAARRKSTCTVKCLILRTGFFFRTPATNWFEYFSSRSKTGDMLDFQTKRDRDIFSSIVWCYVRRASCAEW